MYSQVLAIFWNISMECLSIVSYTNIYNLDSIFTSLCCDVKHMFRPHILQCEIACKLFICLQFLHYRNVSNSSFLIKYILALHIFRILYRAYYNWDLLPSCSPSFVLHQGRPAFSGLRATFHLKNHWWSTTYRGLVYANED